MEWKLDSRAVFSRRFDSCPKLGVEERTWPVASRLALAMVSLHKEQPLRMLVPMRRADGSIEYRVETRRVRLPLRRKDRQGLDERLLQS
jgi:hypothetical protein